MSNVFRRWSIASAFVLAAITLHADETNTSDYFAPGNSFPATPSQKSTAKNSSQSPTTYHASDIAKNGVKELSMPNDSAVNPQPAKADEANTRDYFAPTNRYSATPRQKPTANNRTKPQTTYHLGDIAQNGVAQSGNTQSRVAQNAVAQNAVAQSGVEQLAVPDYSALNPQLAMIEQTALPITPEVSSIRWWHRDMQIRRRETSPAIKVSIHDLVTRALRHSAQVQAIQDAPLIQETAIIESSSAFDWVSFWDTTWDDINNPVGSTLTTGSANRFTDRNINGNAGVRRRNVYGGQFELAQRLGHQNTNSDFFVPNNQGSARLTLSYTHPLLRGKGKVYNTSFVCLAKLDTRIAFDQASQELQEHLQDIATAYWSLYQERATLAVRLRLQQKLQELLGDIEARRSVDTYNIQVARANAAIATSQASLVRARAGVTFAEARIRSLVNDPALGTGYTKHSELIPTEIPIVEMIDVQPADAVSAALQLRPEVRQAIKRIKSAAIQQQLTKNELLPQLNLVTSVFSSGLQGNSNVGRAFIDQFQTGRPSYSVGLQYELPIGNRAALARHQRRQLESRRLGSIFRATTEQITMEALNAVGEVQAAFQEASLQQLAVEASRSELQNIYTRWKYQIGSDRTAGLVLDDILRANERLSGLEIEFVNSSLAYNLALMNLKRATGTLLQAEQVDMGRGCQCRLPVVKHEKVGPGLNHELYDAGGMLETSNFDGRQILQGANAQ